MRPAAFAITGPITIRSDPEAEVSARLTDRGGGRFARYRPWHGTTRFVAIGAALAVHLIVAGIVLYDWRWPERSYSANTAIVVTFVPPTPDHHVQKPVRGVPAETTAPQIAAVPPPLAMVDVHPPEASLAAISLPEPAAVIDAGREEQIALASNAYSHAILARIQEQRSYPRGALLSGVEGNGLIRFTIDRAGHLLDAAIVTSTGRKALDRASLALVRRAEPFPAIPPGLPDELAITMPIRFLIVRPEQRMAAR